MLSSRPLYDNLADARFFVRPEEWGELNKAIEAGLNVIVPGDPGVGKTTALLQLLRELRESNRPAIYADAFSARDELELVSRIHDALLPEDEDRESDGSIHALLQSIAGAKRTTILLDASNAGELVYELFGRHRDAVWQGPHIWVVAIEQGETSLALMPPADAFFDVLIPIGNWKPEPLSELLKKRDEGFSDPELGVVAANALGNPRRALRALAASAVRGGDPGSYITKRVVLQEKASRLGRPHSMLLTELMDRGEASASDSDLQESLGVTRGRLSQLLQVLEENGLVTSFVAPPAGPGRPRTVYRPAFENV